MGMMKGSGGSPVYMSTRQMQFCSAVIIVLVVGAFLTALNVYELHRLTQEHWAREHSEGEEPNSLDIKLGV